jgi:hypothetical protein
MPRHTEKRTKSQSQLFVEKARELGCDEDEAAFEARLKKIATATTAPKKDVPKGARKRG